MRMTNRDQRRLFYVVQFIELPFENIDDYVCVPYSWIIFRKSSNRKIVVTYPNNEDPLETRERVRRKERPNDLWRFYTAYLKYGSDEFVDLWIARNESEHDQDELKNKDTKPKPKLNRKFRSANQRNLDEPQVTIKPYKNPRKPLPRISIRRPLSKQSNQHLNNKCLKLNKNPEPVVISDHITTASDSSKQEQSIIITGNQVIQKDLLYSLKTNITSNDEMNEQSTQAEVIKENQPVDLSFQSTSAKLPVEHQLSRKPPTEQQLSLQPPIDRQPLPEFIAEQHPSSVGQAYQQSVSMSTVEMNNSEGDIDSSQNVLPEPVTDVRPSTKTFKPAPQPNPMNERHLVHQENSLPESHSRDVTAGQTKEPNDWQQTHHWILTEPKIVPRSHSTTNQLFQQHGYPSLPNFSLNSTLNSKFQHQGFGERNSNQVADYQSFLRYQGINNSMPSTSHHKHISEKLQHPPNSMKQLGLSGSSAVAQSVPFAPHRLQTAQIDGLLMNDDRRENFISQRDPRLRGMMNTPAAQYLSKLAHHYNPFLGKLHEQQYLPTREKYLQQFTRLQDMLVRPTMTPTLDREVYHQNAMMNGGFIIQSQLYPINQPTQFLPQNVNIVPINSAYSQQVKSHELMKRHTDGAHVTYKPVTSKEVNIQFSTHHSAIQSHWDAEHPQKEQDQQNYRDPRTTNTQNGLPLKSTHGSLIPKPHKVTKRSRSHSISKSTSQALFDAQRNCLIQELGIQEIVSQSSTKSNNTNLAAISETQTVELASSTKNTEVQTMLSSNEIQATQFTLIPNEHNSQCSAMKKTMNYQATEMDSIMDDSHYVEAIAGTLPESASRAVDSVCQTDEWLEKEKDSLHQETALDYENATDNAIESENEVVPETNRVTLTAEQNPTQENQHEQSRIVAEQDKNGNLKFDKIVTLFAELGANVSSMRDMFDCLRNSSRVCEQTFETLLNKVNLNLIESFPNSASPPNNVKSQITQGIPAGDNNNITNVDNATLIREQRSTFSLPAEYDPNDTKWTLKYRENKPGLVELIPNTGVYVKRKELKRCIRKSNDCRTLARLLLTEVFRHDALSVCSWTGGKAKAFKSVNIDIRPGLDENARVVLLTFVEKHGKESGWCIANTSAVMSTIRTKIIDIRTKHQQTCKV